MFCTNQKNAFLFRKSSVLIPNCQSYSSEKQRKSNIFSLLYICCPSCGRNPKALPLLIPCRSILYLSLPVGGAVCWQVCLYACLPAGRSVGKQARWQDGRQAGWSAGRLAGQRAYAYMLLFIALLLLHYYVDRRMYCTTDLYHSNSTSLKPQSIADTFI